MTARRNRRRQGSRRSGLAFWTPIFVVCAVGGLAVGAAFYLRDWRNAKPDVEPTATAARPAPPRPAIPSQRSGRFEFYEMLPKSEVVIPDVAADSRPDTTPSPLEVPGVYVLQAGAFSAFAEADRMKAQLALLGITSEIQRIAVEEQQYHRVRIGPIENLEELNRLRRRLRDAKIDALVVRVGE
jgi:cell division protein FtsN